MSRAMERSGFPTDIRISLLEGDADRTDAWVENFAQRIERRINALTGAVLAAALSLTTATVVMGFGKIF